MKDKEYIVALETCNGVAVQWLADWRGDPGRTAIEESAKRYKSISSATYALARARKYNDYMSAQIIAVDAI